MWHSAQKGVWCTSFWRNLHKFPLFCRILLPKSLSWIFELIVILNVYFWILNLRLICFWNVDVVFLCVLLLEQLPVSSCILLLILQEKKPRTTGFHLQSNYVLIFSRHFPKANKNRCVSALNSWVPRTLFRFLCINAYTIWFKFVFFHLSCIFFWYLNQILNCILLSCYIDKLWKFDMLFNLICRVCRFRTENEN